MTRVRKKFYTKEEIKRVISLWDNMSVEDMAEELGRGHASILYIASRIRKCGWKLSKKMRVGRVDSLISEVIRELEE